ncbi:hypothetical protein CDAR_171861 [Caerostris darwini]|uniref:Uncharacterized protein n=1 Tax=Caerostris darwini TaxID=1538125 RepID=A0AAV4MP98_9ARAC|nr:hypothetical protein CDAR_171861 [Caerostris darwini]
MIKVVFSCQRCIFLYLKRVSVVKYMARESLQGILWAQIKTNTCVTTLPKLITSPNEESPHSSVTQFAGITAIVTATVIFAAVDSDSQSMSRRIHCEQIPQRSSLIQPIERPHALRQTKQLRFHFAKVEINTAFRKHSSEWEMHNDICIFMADGSQASGFESRG